MYTQENLKAKEGALDGMIMSRPSMEQRPEGKGGGATGRSESETDRQPDVNVAALTRMLGGLLQPHMQGAWHGIQVLCKCQSSISSPME